jgi:hypothetical protein
VRHFGHADAAVPDAFEVSSETGVVRMIDAKRDAIAALQSSDNA